MADDRFCRFATKLVVNGVTLVDGVLSTWALNIVMDGVLRDNGLPPMDMRTLYAAPEGQHFHYDICVNGGFIAFEVSALAGPVPLPKRVGESRPDA